MTNALKCGILNFSKVVAAMLGTSGDWQTPQVKEQCPQMNSSTNQSFVYVIHAKSTRLFKVGISNRPSGRLKELQTANGHELQMIALWHGGKQQEQLLHTLFKAYRAKGEWFEHPEKLALSEIVLHVEMALGAAVKTFIEEKRAAITSTTCTAVPPSPPVPMKADVVRHDLRQWRALKCAYCGITYDKATLLTIALGVGVCHTCIHRWAVNIQSKKRPFPSRKRHAASQPPAAVTQHINIARLGLVGIACFVIAVLGIALTCSGGKAPAKHVEAAVPVPSASPVLSSTMKQFLEIEAREPFAGTQMLPVKDIVQLQIDNTDKPKGDCVFKYGKWRFEGEVINNTEWDISGLQLGVAGEWYAMPIYLAPTQRLHIQLNELRSYTPDERHPERKCEFAITGAKGVKAK